MNKPFNPFDFTNHNFQFYRFQEPEEDEIQDLPTDILGQLKPHVSSVYAPSPLFGFPTIGYEEPQNRWESIAKEVLTPFAPKYPTYDYQKFIPPKHQSPIHSPLLPDAIDPENSPLFAFTRRNEKTLFSFSPKTDRTINKPKDVRKNPFAKVSFTETPNWKLQSDRIRGPGESKARPKVRPLKLDNDEERSSTFLKSFFSKDVFVSPLRVKLRFENTPTARVQSRADFRKTERRDGEETKSQYPSKEFLDNGKSDSVISMNEELKKSVSHVEPIKKEIIRVIPPKNTMIVKPMREILKPRDMQKVTQNSDNSNRSQNQSDIKSREGTVGNESRFSNVGKKSMLEESKLFMQSGLKRSIRRKSDTSSYSGGECMKLSKNLDIVLFSDLYKKTGDETPNFFASVKKDGPVQKWLDQKKKKRQDKNSESVPTSPMNLLNIPRADNTTRKASMVDMKMTTFDLPVPKLELPQDIVKKSPRRPSNLQAKLNYSRSNVLQMQNRLCINTDLADLISRTIDNETTQRSKYEGMETQCSTTREIRTMKNEFKKRLKGGDLCDAFKSVLSLNRKAEATVFKEREARQKIPKGVLKRVIKSESKRDNKLIPLEDLSVRRNVAPYLNSLTTRSREISQKDRKMESSNSASKKKYKQMRIRCVYPKSYSLSQTTIDSYASPKRKLL